MLFPVTEFAPAKLNLTLQITGKREDGYHLLDSLVVFTEFGDTLQFYPHDTVTLEMEGEFAGALHGGPDNLILRAAQALKEHTQCRQGARIVLHKRIPVSGGLGGGSSDAAATLRGLMQLWKLSVSPEALCKLALPLGSDVPVCLAMRPAVMRGIGERITPVECHMDEAWAVIVNPRVPLATAEVYGRFNGTFDTATDMPAIASLEALLNEIASRHNALEAPAVSLCPAISDVLAVLHGATGCRLARMTGSGASCFGLFAAADDAELAAQRMEQKGWWAAVTPLLQKNTPAGV